ncbi:MAG TPA: hypothetical protein VKD04_00485 [Burkholderiales bacterium]|nr:hypothetical protein [Burkholderiales bacterium]
MAIVLPTAMKKTLYQILGVEPNASVAEIEAAYTLRHAELSGATMRDPNKQVLLQQAKETLSNASQRAAYDASLAIRVAGAPVEAHDEPEPAFLEVWGKWIAVAIVAIGLGVWWAKHTASPPANKPPAPQAVPQDLEHVPQSVQPAQAPASAGDAKAPEAAAVAMLPRDEPASPILGQWSCRDVISGRTSQYNFQPDGTLGVATTDGQSLALTFKVSGSALQLVGSKQDSTYTIEELTARKMILNTGTEGRRLACAR